jgi:hypothetical protein
MTLKLKSLLEGFAWQREAGKPLPTLADTTAAYQRKLDEQDYYRTHKRGKFGPGSRYNDEPDFNYSGKRDVVQNDKWDKLVDEYNNKPGYVVVSGAPRGLYMATITNTETGDEWEIKFKYQQWTYQCKIDGRIKRFDSTADLINNFNEINGMQTEGAFDTTADVYGDPGENTDLMDETAKPDYIDLDKDGNEKETMRKAAADKKSMTESVSLNQRILNNLYGSEYILKEAFKRK